jgi:hypothetical protein
MVEDQQKHGPLVMLGKNLRVALPNLAWGNRFAHLPDETSWCRRNMLKLPNTALARIEVGIQEWKAFFFFIE